LDDQLEDIHLHGVVVEIEDPQLVGARIGLVEVVGIRGRKKGVELDSLEPTERLRRGFWLRQRDGRAEAQPDAGPHKHGSKLDSE
jgi:hypothetical protein